MIYGGTELLYAEPFAEALVDDPAFRQWVVQKTEFAEHAEEARLLHREMLARRSRTARDWWRSHYTEACRCFGCSGQETDLLAIFETPTGFRFAVHIEVKHPGDGFKSIKQAAAYPVRAQCWVSKPPPRVLPHAAATTAPLFSANKFLEYRPYLGYFRSLFTFEDVRGNFSKATPSLGGD